MEPEKNETIVETVEEEIREVIERVPRSGTPLRGGGMFIGTLNIMAEPARGLFTRPLQAWYKNRYHGKYDLPKHRFAFDLGLIGIAIALASVAVYFGFFFKPYDPVEATLTITPAALVSGGEAVAKLRIENKGTNTLDDVTVKVLIPSNITVRQVSLPFDSKEGVIHYGTIEAGAYVEARLVGAISGAVGTSHRASALITYTVRETGAQAKKTAVATINIQRAAVSATFELPDKIIAGSQIEGTIRYRNRSTGPAEDTVISPAWPEGFILTDSTPLLHASGWHIGSVSAGTEGTITFHGNIQPKENTDSVVFAADVGVQNGNDILHQGHVERTTALIDPKISVVISTDKPAARVGEKVAVTITYRNAGTFPGSDATLILNTTGSARTLKSIGPFGPGTSGTASATFTVARPEPDTKQPTAFVTAILRFETDLPENASRPTISIISVPLKINIATETGLSAVARYWSESGEQLGRGPLPPAVGQPTKLWIFWNVRNSSSDVRNVRVSATLPSNVSWTGKASIPYGDPLNFDPDTRTLTWNVGDVPAFPGVHIPAIGAAFEVALIPTSDQVGTFPLLLIAQKISGTDGFSGLTVSGSAPMLTASLSSDAKAAGKGKVVP
jgi:hypothetical protein